MEMFERALRLKLRFETVKGPLSIEDLYDLPLTSNTGKANLDDVARALHKQLKSGENVSFVEPDRKSDEIVQLRFDIVKHVIDVRLEENKAALEKKERAEKKQVIMSIIADKQNEDLRKMPMEELKKALEGL